jgi:hypothetical protein
MTTTALHTHGWRVGDAGHTVFGPKKIDGSSPEIIATVKKGDNSRLIVRAVNSHDELLAACKAASDPAYGLEVWEQLQSAIQKAEAQP